VKNCSFPDAAGANRPDEWVWLSRAAYVLLCFSRATFLKSAALMVASDLADEILTNRKEAVCIDESPDWSLPVSAWANSRLQAEDFKLLDRNVEIHGFASQDLSTRTPITG